MRARYRREVLRERTCGRRRDHVPSCSIQRPGPRSVARPIVGSQTILMATTLHKPANPVRFVTASSLFDGHDAAINIMRRILQSQGAEVIHLGHNRSVDEVVRAAVQEDVQGVAISSYQGGHVEMATPCT